MSHVLTLEMPTGGQFLAVATSAVDCALGIAGVAPADRGEFAAEVAAAVGAVAQEPDGVTITLDLRTGGVDVRIASGAASRTLHCGAPTTGR